MAAPTDDPVLSTLLSYLHSADHLQEFFLPVRLIPIKSLVFHEAFYWLTIIIKTSSSLLLLH